MNKPVSPFQIVIVVLVILGFILFIWAVSAVSQNPPVGQTTQTPAIASSTQTPTPNSETNSPQQISVADIPSLAQSISTSSIVEPVVLIGAVTKTWPDNEFEINDGTGNALIQITGQEQSIAPLMAQIAVGDRMHITADVNSSALVGYTTGWFLKNPPNLISESIAFSQVPTNTIFLDAMSTDIKIISTPPTQSQPQATWHTAFTYSGNASIPIINTKNFFVQGSQWKVSYSCDAPVSFGNFDILFRAVQNVDSVPPEIQESNCPTSNVVDESNQYPGYYSLSIYPQGSFTLTIQDYY